MNEIANQTDGFSGSDLREMCRNACIYTMRDFIRDQRSSTRSGFRGHLSVVNGFSRFLRVDVGCSTFIQMCYCLFCLYFDGIHSREILILLLFLNFYTISEESQDDAESLRPVSMDDLMTSLHKTRETKQLQPGSISQASSLPLD